MLITSHALQGALIGRAVRRPLAAAVLGFASHLAADTVPHWGSDADLRSPAFLKVAVPDGLAGLAAIALVTATSDRERRLSTMAGMFGACLPDVDKPSNLAFGWSPFPQRFDDFHGAIQTESPRRMPQELLVISSLALAFWATRGRGRG